MVARGDLAVEVGVAKVPVLQKHIIKHARGIFFYFFILFFFF
jgi:pyruvate kinase